MNRTVRRAGAFSVVGALALPAPLLGRAAVLPFLAVAVLAVAVTDGPLFDLFARPGDREYGRLRSLFDFALAATVLAGLAAFGGLPVPVFAGTVLLVALGNLGAEFVRAETDQPATLGFLAGGVVGAVGGTSATTVLAGGTPHAGELLLLSTTGVLLGGLVRSMLFPRDEPPVVLSVGLVLWFLAAIGAGTDAAGVAAAVAVIGAFGVLSYVLETATLEGVLAGVFVGLLTIVLGGWAWFALLLTFFGLGGLATKFRYEQKVEHGVAEDNDGSRGGENVLANSLVALGAVFLAAAIRGDALPEPIAGVAPDAALPALFCFAGALATAFGDTLSSEIGGAFDAPRLVTTFERVPPGTDGAVTWQGTLAGIGGATAMGALAAVLFPVEPIALAVVAAGGFVGMSVDSLLGATVEGGAVGNAAVNFTATLGGALGCVALAVAAGLV